MQLTDKQIEKMDRLKQGEDQEEVGLRPTDKQIEEVVSQSISKIGDTVDGYLDHQSLYLDQESQGKIFNVSSEDKVTEVLYDDIFQWTWEVDAQFDEDGLYDEHFNWIKKKFADEGFPDLAEEDIEAVKDALTEGVYIDYDVEKALDVTSSNIVISYNPVSEDTDSEAVFPGFDGVSFEEDGSIDTLPGEYKPVLEMLGSSIQDIIDWSKKAAIDAKGRDPESDYFSKYSKGDPLHGKKAHEDKFTFSVYEEIENQNYDSTGLIFLVKMPLRDALDLKLNKGKITLGKDTTVGLFDYIQGSGSLLGIELREELTLDLNSPPGEEGAFNIYVDGEGPGYGVDSVYGLTGSAWETDFKIVSEAEDKKVKNKLESENISLSFSQETPEVESGPSNRRSI